LGITFLTIALEEEARVAFTWVVSYNIEVVWVETYASNNPFRTVNTFSM
jgi:hypothetical protein